jgi:ribosome-interacting GTPase 1
VIRTNFLDEANFDALQAQLVRSLGLLRVTVLRDARPDADGVSLMASHGSVARDIAERAAGVDESAVAAASVWGASVKHPGQEVGLSHLVRHGDRIHFRA